MKNLVQKFVKDESGATAIEYSLLAGLIGIAMFAGANSLGNNIGSKFTTVAGKVTSAN